MDWFVADKSFLEASYLPLNNGEIYVEKQENNLASHSVSTQKVSQIDSSQLEFEAIIGKGSFGQIWKGKWRQTQVAIKQIKQEIVNEKSRNKNKQIHTFKHKLL